MIIDHAFLGVKYDFVEVSVQSTWGECPLPSGLRPRIGVLGKFFAGMTIEAREWQVGVWETSMVFRNYLKAIGIGVELSFDRLRANVVSLV